jgi:hypothetical protein
MKKIVLLGYVWLAIHAGVFAMDQNNQTTEKNIIKECEENPLLVYNYNPPNLPEELKERAEEALKELMSVHNVFYAKKTFF